MLALTVLILWGILIFKFTGELSGDTVADPKYQANTFEIPKTKKKEVYSLIPLEKDPFMGTISNSKKKSAPKKKKQPTINWPQLQYRGMVKGENNSAFILSINGQDQILNRGEQFGEIKLVRGDQKKITVRFKGQTKTVDL